MTSMGFMTLAVQDSHGRRVTLTAERLSEHFAITPAVVTDRRSHHLAYDGQVWDLQHLPTRQVLYHLRPDARSGCFHDAVQRLAQWLEHQTDWSIADPATVTELPPCDDPQIVHAFHGDAPWR